MLGNLTYDELKTEYEALCKETQEQKHHIAFLESVRGGHQQRLLELSEAVQEIQDKCFDLRTALIAADVQLDRSRWTP